jgi:hypothetical protein
MFVTVDSGDLAREVCRGANNCIKSEGRERKIKEVIKNRIII